MTIATDRGFEIGKLYRGKSGKSGKRGEDLEGCIFEFVSDDGSDMPIFKFIYGGYTGFDIGMSYWIRLDNLESDDTPTTAQVCGTPSTKELLILYVQQHHTLDKVLNVLVSAL